MAPSRIVGRKATGNIDDMTTAELAALFGMPDGTKFFADDDTLTTSADGTGGGWTLISPTVVVAAATVDLTSIPGTYHSLML